MGKMKKAIVFSLLFIVIIVISIFVIFDKKENNNIKENLLQYDKFYYSTEEDNSVDNEKSYITFFSDNSCTTSMFPVEKCTYELTNNDMLFVSMDLIIKSDNNTSVNSLIEMYFEIIDEETINCYYSKIGFDKESLVDGNFVGRFTTSYSIAKNLNDKKTKEWHKSYNLASSDTKIYATIDLFKGDYCEIDFSKSSKSVNISPHQYMMISYKNGTCSYKQTSDLDFIIKYDGTYDVTNTFNQELDAYGLYVFQTKNQEMKITFTDNTYTSFKITNGEWDFVNYAIYLKPNDNDLDTSNNDNNDDKNKVDTYFYWPLEEDETIKSIAEKFEMNYKVLLIFNDISDENSSDIDSPIKIPISSVFSKLDKEIYNNIQTIQLYIGGFYKRGLRITMKDGNIVVVSFEHLSDFKEYPKLAKAIANQTDKKVILYLDGTNTVSINE